MAEKTKINILTASTSVNGGGGGGGGGCSGTCRDESPVSPSPSSPDTWGDGCRGNVEPIPLGHTYKIK